MNKIYLGNFNISTSKFGSGDTTMYIGANKVYPMDAPAGCIYDVTSNISTYTARTYSEVYDSTQKKWFMRNNLNQYEEYGIYGEGKNITTYQGKLTIDSGHEWQWSGSSWVDLGEVSGGTGSLPAVSFSVNYNARDYDQTTSSLTMTADQNVEYSPVVSGNPITINDGYITVTGNSRAVIPSTWKDYFNRGSSNPNLTIVCKAKTISAGGSGGGNIIANRGGNYNWMYRQYSDKLTLHGTSECTPLTITNDGQPKICSIRVNSSRDVILNNWSEETTSTVSNFSYGSNNSDGCALFCGYSTTSNEWWNGDFYWVYVSQETLTDAQIEDVIDYNENGGIDIPVEYSDIEVPPTSVTFQSVAEMEAYACAYDGLIGFVGTDAYIYTRADGWQFAPPTDKPYLTFVATEAGTFKLSGNSVDYSINGGISWLTLPSNTDSPTVPAGGTIMFKAGLTPTYNGIGKFTSTGRFTAKGNPMCLVFGDDFENKTSLSGKNYAFKGLFSGCTGLTSAENMSLPATTLASKCYEAMFKGCTSLTTAPELPGTTLASSCYHEMFYSCASLTTAPVLSATTLANECYSSMFDGCTSLTTAPSLPATTLAFSCYGYMFDGCRRLTTAPVLSATTLANECYSNMFAGCTSLTTSPSLPATTLADSCYESMFEYCKSLTTAPSLPATTLADNCYKDMFNGCTSLTTAPVLPATTLANKCYSGMFYRCTSLVNAPSLPATTLTDGCYGGMFQSCTNLNSITCLATSISASNCTINWVNGVAASGTFIKNPSMSSWTTGTNGIPSGWTVQDAS